MKNVEIEAATYYKTNIKDASFVSYSDLNQSLYVATKDVVYEYSVVSKEITSHISLTTEGYLNDTQRIVSMQYLSDENCVCITTSKGDVLLIDTQQTSLECVGSVDDGLVTSLWSPDYELLVLVTGNNTFILMTKDFDPITESPLQAGQDGEAAQVSVGWGKKETQFHGSEGKEAAKQVKQTLSSVQEWDSCMTHVTWRGDGQLFAISTVDKSTNSRYINIYNREGILQNTNEIIEGLEECISWRPSGNLIASSQRKPNKHDIIFFEKNGLQHGEFTLPFQQKEKMVVGIFWNMDSDILTLLLQDMNYKKNYNIQVWVVGNYHWYLKQEFALNMDEQLTAKPVLEWDTIEPYLLHGYYPDGTYWQFRFKFGIKQSEGAENLAMVAVIDGAKVLLTPFKLMIVPPPMSTYSLKMESSVNAITFGTGVYKHDLLAWLSSNEFQLARYSDKQYTTHSVTFENEFKNFVQLIDLIWRCGKDIVAVSEGLSETHVLFMDLDMEKFTMKIRKQIPVREKGVSLIRSEDERNLVILQNQGGLLFKVDEENELLDPCTVALPQYCSCVTYAQISGEDVVFGLTNHYRLFMNSKEIASNCTSFMLHDEFLLLTTHSHTLRCVYLSSLHSGKDLSDIAVDEAVRRVERGSKIVTVVRQGTAVILQMPRGNLESIHPRALVVTYLQKLLSDLDYGKAMEIMRKNRINLNLVYDHDPKLFLDSVDKFIEKVSSVNHINHFLADLTSEDVCSTLYYPFYHHGVQKTKDNYGKSSETKVDVICQAVRKGIENIDVKKYFLALLTTYAKQTEPDLESVLVKIKHLKDHSSTSNVDSQLSHGAALKYILYLVDVNHLFDIALGLYDFEICLMVAQKSQKDPKEYIPFLNNFQKEKDEHYRKYSIDKYLKRHKKALQHLTRCGDRFNELTEFVKENKLYKDSIKLFDKKSEEYKKLSYLYAEYLTSQKLYDDAGLIYSRTGHHEEALAVFIKTTNWNMVLTEAKLLNYSDIQLHELAQDICGKLKENHMYEAAAHILEYYIKDIEECVVCLLEGGLWFHALHVIKKYSRDDLIETNLVPTLIEHAEQHTEKIKDLSEKFGKYKERLRVVLETRELERLEILQGIREDPENDLYSDTSSITGQSAMSVGSKGTRTSGHSAKSRTKMGRKKYSLREGSKHEDFALREALAEIVNTTDSMKEEIASLLNMLVYYFREEMAAQLQRDFATLLELLENNMDDIWVSKPESGVNEQNQYGPDATVQSIIAQRQKANTNNTKNVDLPKPTHPNLRKNISWKLHVLR